MCLVVISVLNVAFGLLWSKVRDHTVEKFKKGDVTDEMFRKLIVRELDDIKSKLDGLARKDLLSSVEFLKEGISVLRMCVDGLTDDRNSSMAKRVPNEELPFASSNFSQAMTNLKITSEDRFKLAKKSFKAAREEATKAFSNEALSTKDRIHATKLRITCSIMENLEDPELAVTNAKTYLEALHYLPAIKKAFCVHLDGGIKSLFKNSRRREIVQSVKMISSVLYDFTRRFTKVTHGLFDWPQIELEQRIYHPLSVDQSISLGDFGVVRPRVLQFRFCGKFQFRTWLSAVNSKGEIITSLRGDAVTVSVINREGECRIFCSLPSEGTSVATDHWIEALAVDEEDNVYIVSFIQATYPATRSTLFVFDSNANIKHQCSLHFLHDVRRRFLWNLFKISPLCIAINKEKRVAITESGSDTVFICDDNGQLEAKFHVENGDSDNSQLCCSDTNEIFLGSPFDKTVAVYTEEGNLKRKIELPKRHRLRSVAFNHITKNIVVLTAESQTLYLLNYSETDTPQSFCLGKYKYHQVEISSHPSGQVALIHRELGVAYI